MGCGAVDRRDRFALVEVCCGGYVCVCVLLGGLIGNGGLGCRFLPL